MSISTQAIHNTDTNRDPNITAARHASTSYSALWEHPRAPRLEPAAARIRARFAHQVLADSTEAVRVVRPGFAPVYYIPPADVQTQYLVPITTRPVCACFMPAWYFHVMVEECVATAAAWSFPDPLPAYEALRDYIAFAPDKLDAFEVAPFPPTVEADAAPALMGADDRQALAAVGACADLAYW